MDTTAPTPSSEPTPEVPLIPLAPTVPPEPEPPQLGPVEKPKNQYFDNMKVEELLTVYVIGGCTDVLQRDEIMSHAAELIRQIIRTHNLHNIYPGRDQASFGDLFQVAWCQIEKTLYKFNHGPGHTKVFNMWSQIARTVMLAHIKREGRDRKNQGAYSSHLNVRHSFRPAILDRFFNEAREICKYNDEHMELLKHLGELYDVDERASEGLIGKLIKKSGKSRQKVHAFLSFVRMRSVDFSDSPASANSTFKPYLTGTIRGDHDDDGED